LIAAGFDAVAASGKHAATDFEALAKEAVAAVREPKTMLRRAVEAYASVDTSRKKAKFGNRHTKAGLAAEPLLIARAQEECGLLARHLGDDKLVHNDSLYVHPTQ
jgi:hypothetical protein